MRRSVAMWIIVMVTLAGTVALVAAPSDTTQVVAAEETLNQVDDWCDSGFKYEPVATPFVVPAPAAGTTWTLLVLKAGQDNFTVANPTPGYAYYAENEKDISHAILCYTTTTTSTTEPPTTTTSTPSTTTTIPPTTTTSTTVEPTTTTTVGRSTTTTVPVTTTTTVVTTTTICQPAPCK